MSGGRTTLVGLLVMVLAFEARADQFVQVSDSGTVRAAVSAQEVTRISFVGDRPASVQLAIGGENEAFSIVQEPQRGDLYLTFVDGARVEEAVFFVTTSAEMTYRFELVPDANGAAQIHVRNPQLDFEALRGGAAESSYEDRIVELIRAMWRSELLRGYERVDFPADKNRTVGKLRWRLLASYEGASLLGQVIEVRNTSREDARLSEGYFMPDGVVALSVKGGHELSPGASRIVLRVLKPGS